MRLLLSILFVAWPALVWAAPSISDYSGTVDDGQQVTITGTGFGANGPTLQVFDNFDDGGPAGSLVDLTGTVNSWDSRSSGIYDVVYSATSRSGSSAIEVSDDDGVKQYFTGLNKDFSATTEAFLSFAVQVPSGTYFPHSVETGTHDGSNNAAGLTDSSAAFYPDRYVNAVLENLTDGSSCIIASHTSTSVTCSTSLSGGTDNDFDVGDEYDLHIQLTEFPRESAWKMSWLRDYVNDPDSSPGDDDVCWPSHTSFELLRTSGNDLNSVAGSAEVNVHQSGDTWWQWGGWNRISVYSKADATNPATANGYVWGQGIGEGVEQSTRIDNANPVFGGGTAPYQWTRLHISGWNRATDIAYPINPLYDDIYFATGAGAAARVEIGNASTYAASTKLAIATIDSWADNSVTATVREGDFSNGDSVYLFVIDANNDPSTGYGPLTFGDGSPSITNVTGTVDHEESITITGSNFGTHADHSTYGDGKAGLAFAWENFEGTAPDINFWDKSAGSGGPVADTSGNNKTNSTKCVKHEKYATGQNFTDIFGRSHTDATIQHNMGIHLFNDGASDPGTQQIIHQSGWFMIPTGYYDAMNTTQADVTQDQWKVMGVTSNQTGDADGPKTYFNFVEYETLGGWLSMSTLTEDTQPTNNHGDLLNYVTEGEWFRLDVYVDTSQPSGQDTFKFYVDGQKIREGNYNTSCGGYECPEQWKFINWAFLKQYVTTDDNWPIYSDDLFADFTPARVELCAEATWDDSATMDCELQIPTSWSDGSVTVSVNTGRSSTGTRYLYVVNADDAVNTTGYAVSLSGAAAVSTPVSAGTTPINAAGTTPIVTE